MSLDRDIGKTQQPLLPPDRSQQRPLLIVMTIMAFLAALVMLLSTISIRATTVWQNDLDGTASVQIFDNGVDDIEASTQKAVEILRDFSDLSDVSLLSESDGQKLLQPWLGTVDLPDDIIVPRLITVKAGADTNFAAITARLSEDGLITAIDDHKMIAGQFRRTGRTIQTMAWIIFGLVLIATMAMSAFATQASLTVYRKIIRVLTQVGAQNGYIAWLFVKRFFVFGIIAGILGSIAALICVAMGLLIVRLGGDTSLLGAVHLQTSSFIVLIWMPFLLAVISASVAGLICLSILKSLHRAQ